MHCKLQSMLAALLMLVGNSLLCVACCCTGGLDNDDIDLNLPTPTTQQPPVAVISATPDIGVEPLAVQLDASASHDPDGVIVTYDWDFYGDGNWDLLDGGPTPEFTYSTSATSSLSKAASFVETGQFSPNVRVTDNDGLTDEASTTVTVGELLPPVAVVSATPSNGLDPLDVQLDASASHDDDGEIVQYDWDFDGNGTYDLMDGGATPVHTYSNNGTASVSFVETGQFHAVVRVTDDDGLTGEASTTITVGELVPPTADLVATPAAGDVPLDVTWDASGSSDSDGTIVQYDWDMDNDGTYEISDGGSSQSATYDPGSIYTVGVRVTDDDGLTDATTASTDVNNPPVADLLATPPAGNSPLDVTWDATGSTDSDGTTVTYDWDMDNDGDFEILDGGDTRNATYTSSGIYTVGVRVTDDDGATDTTMATTDVNDPPTAALTNTFEALPLQESFVIHWDASGSTDSDGTIVQYDWDMDNDGTFEITAGGDHQDMDYSDWSFLTVPVVGVRVTDNDGAQDQTTASTLFPPLGLVTATPTGGTAPLAVTWDASTSWDPDGGSIVQYDWDMDNDGTFEIPDGGATQPANYAVGGFYTIQVRVTDDEGETGVGQGFIFVSTP